ncbi:MAG: GNAT family N-acetyltransferase [Flavobacteriia bacterium]|nr:GNAT family N-acetyltransferase [Flavobacteriia bacterium]
MKARFEIIPYGSEKWKEAVRLREGILRAPFGLKFTSEELEEEKSHIQIAGLIDDKIIATTVLVPEPDAFKMQRVVVAEKLRSSNIGSDMMAFCEDYILRSNRTSVYCHARDSAVNFYLRNSYSPEGDYFDEDGIPHLKMKKVLR